MISLGFEYLWIFTNGKEYSVWHNLFWIFQDAPWEQTGGLAMVHHEAFEAAWNPARRAYSRQQRPGDAFLNDCAVFFITIFSQHSTEFHFHFCSCKTKCLWKTQKFLTNCTQAYLVFLVVEFLSLCFGQTNDGAVTRDGRQGAQLTTSPALHREQNNSCICF